MTVIVVLGTRRVPARVLIGLTVSVSLCASACGGDAALPMGGDSVTSESVTRLRESPESDSSLGAPVTSPPGAVPGIRPLYGDTQGLARRFHTVEGGSEFSPSDGALVTVRPRDTIPAILDPAFARVEDASEWMESDELVLGVEIEGDARAYPIRILSRHEVVNDIVGGEPIAITW